MRLALICVLFLATNCGPAARAQTPPTPEETAQTRRLTEIRDSLHPVHGLISLPQGSAQLKLGTDYYWLGRDDAKRVLVQGWSNPPAAAEGVLGMIFPTGKTFMDDSWGAVVTYDSTAYVSDATPKPDEYDKLLADMRSGEDEANAERKKGGFDSVALIGWAQPPTYDKSHNDLIWARELRFGAQSRHTLNYDVRHLGRRGVLSLNMVSTMDQIGEIRPAAVELARTAEFQPGARYGDYHMGDKTAGYGLVGLVAAGVGLAVVKKAGLLAIALLFFKKAAVLVVGAFAGVGAWIRKLFKKKDL